MPVNLPPTPPPCIVFHCGPIAQPNVWLVYVNREPDAALTSGIRAVVEGGYLDANPAVGSGHLVGVQTATLATHQFGAIPYLTESDLLPLVITAPGSITLFVLPMDTRAVPPDTHCNGCLVASSYHGVTGTPGVAYAVVQGFDPATRGHVWTNLGLTPPGGPPQLYEAAHEVEEAAADAENEDACGIAVQRWGPYDLGQYRVNGVCVSGPAVDFEEPSA